MAEYLLRKMYRFLLVDDESVVLRSVARLLRRNDVLTASGFPEAEALLQRHPVDVVVSDYSMGAGRNGADVLRRAAELRPESVRVMLSGCPPDDIEELVKQGILHKFFAKPIGPKFEADLYALVESLRTP